MPVADSLDERPLLEDEGARGIGDVGAEVLGEVGVLVVVEADEPALGGGRREEEGAVRGGGVTEGEGAARRGEN